MRSNTAIILNQWNTLTVYRYRWDAWIQLNNGQRIQGRSKVSKTSTHKYPVALCIFFVEIHRIKEWYRNDALKNISFMWSIHWQ